MLNLLPPEMAKMTKNAKMALLHAKNPENGQNRQKLTKSGVFDLPVVPHGVWQQMWATVEIFFWIPRFFGSKKAIFGNFWATCGLHAKWAKRGEIPNLGPKSDFFWKILRFRPGSFEF